MESNNYSNILKDNLTFLRRNAKMTQEQFAEKLGLSFQAVSKWENGLSCPDITLLPQIAKIYGITIDELFTPISPENMEKPAEEPASEPEPEASKTQRSYYGDIHLDEALSYLSQKAQQVGAVVGQSATEFAHTAQRMAKAAWSAKDGVPNENGEPGVVINGLPWEDDGQYRGVIYWGRKQVTEAIIDQGDIQLPEECGDLCSAFALCCETIEGDIRHTDAPLHITGSVEGDVIQCDTVQCDTIEEDAVQCNIVHCGQWEGKRIFSELPNGKNSRKRRPHYSTRSLGDIPADRIYRALLFRGHTLLTVPTEDGAALVSYASPEELSRFRVQGETLEGDLCVSLGSCTIETVEGSIIRCGLVTAETIEGSAIQCDTVTCHTVEGDVVQ